MNSNIVVLTNASAAEQRSMIGYGQLLVSAIYDSGRDVREARAPSIVAHLLPNIAQGVLRRLALKIDRFLCAPIRFCGLRADIVHIVDPGNIVYFPFLKSEKCIVTVHDMIPYLAQDGRLPGWRPTKTGRLLMWAIRTQLRKVSCIVCVSESTKKDLILYGGIPEGKITVIPNAVFQAVKPMSDHACDVFRKKVGLPIGSSIVLHIGYSFYKNRRTVVEVFSQVQRHQPDTKLVLVGDVDASLKSMISDFGMAEDVYVLSSVDAADMGALYSTASVLLFPSLYEGFGLPVLEAQICGTPVVCSDRGALLEVAGPSCHVYDVEDIAGMVTGVLKTMDIDVPEYELPEKFSKDAWWRAHDELYSELSQSISR